MKRILLLLLFCFCSNSVHAEIYPLENHNLGYSYQNEQNLLDMLLFAEKQIFKKNYKKDSLIKRLERLELAVYGAIQDGIEAIRIQNIKRAVTNVASGGNGLQYITKSMDLSRNSSNGNFWSFGNSAWGLGDCNCRNSIGSHPRYYYGYHSNRLPHRGHHHSHRVPPPKPPCYHQNNNPIVNGDFSRNYSMGTSVKILDD